MDVFSLIYFFCNKMKTILKTFFCQYNYNHLPLFVYLKIKKILKNISNFWFFYFLFFFKKIKEHFNFIFFKNVKKYIRVKKFITKFFIKYVLSFIFINNYKYMDKDADDSEGSFF